MPLLTKSARRPRHASRSGRTRKPGVHSAPMQPRLSLVTLGVADSARARAFYEAMGFIASGASNPHVAFFQANGLALAHYGRAALAQDAHLSDTAPGFSGIALAYNVRRSAEADTVIAAAAAAGGHVVKPAQAAFWGGYSGYFADPDGYLWEVAHNPHFALDRAGNLKLPR